VASHLPGGWAVQRFGGKAVLTVRARLGRLSALGVPHSVDRFLYGGL
jgi:hypothetical protein